MVRSPWTRLVIGHRVYVVTDVGAGTRKSTSAPPPSGSGWNLLPVPLALHYPDVPWRRLRTQCSVPRSAKDLTGGIVYFARMLDRIRFRGAGDLRSDLLDDALTITDTAFFLAGAGAVVAFLVVAFQQAALPNPALAFADRTIHRTSTVALFTSCHTIGSFVFYSKDRESRLTTVMECLHHFQMGGCEPRFELLDLPE